MQLKQQQLETDMEHRTGSKLGKGYIKAAYCHPAYLTSMQSTSCKMPDWVKHKLESRLPRKISITSDVQMIDTTLIRLVKAMVFPVVMYGCESWTVKKAERPRIDAFELWC